MKVLRHTPTRHLNTRHQPSFKSSAIRVQSSVSPDFVLRLSPRRKPGSSFQQDLDSRLRGNDETKSTFPIPHWLTVHRKSSWPLKPIKSIFILFLLLTTYSSLLTFSAWAGCGATGGAIPGNTTFSGTWTSTVTATVDIGINTNDLCFYVIRATYTLEGIDYAQYLSTSGILANTTTYIQDVGPDANFPRTISSLTPGTTYYFSSLSADDSIGSDATVYGPTTKLITRPGVAVWAPTQVNTWQADNRFYLKPYFNGVPIADNYQFKWDQTSTAWDGTSQDGATSGVANSTQSATAAGNWYFHTRFRDTAGTVISNQDLGPFRFDGSIPTVSSVECRQRDGSTFASCSSSINISTPMARYNSLQDSNSGLVLGQQALGVSSGTVVYLNFEQWPPTDQSGYGSTTTVTGATQSSSGKFGSAASFDGTSGYQIRISSMSRFSASETDYTLEAWVRPADTAARCILYFQRSSGGQRAICYASAGSMALRFDTGGFDTGREVVVANSWNHIVFTCSGGNTAAAYVNGKQIYSTTGCTADLSGNLLIGAAWGGSGVVYSGLIDEVRVLKRALSADEVAANYYSGARKFTRDAGSNWIYDPSTYTATGVVGMTGSDGSTSVQTATGAVNFWNAHATNNQFAFLMRDKVGNVYNTATTVNIPYTAPTFSSFGGESKDGAGFGSLTVNDITPNVRGTVQSQGPAPMRISSAPVSISSDTVLYLDFEEWPPLDKSGYAHHVSSVSGNATLATGFHGQGLSLDGTDDFLIIPRTAELNVNTGDFTASMWFRPSTLSKQQALLNSEVSAGDCGWFSNMDSNGQIGARRGSSTQVTGSTITNTTSWNMLTWVFSGSNFSFYSNGQFVGTWGSQAADSSCNNPLYIGRYPVDTSIDAQGTIDEVKIVKRAMTEAEIRLEYNASRLEFSTDGGSNWITTKTWNSNELQITGSPRTSFAAEVLVSSQVAFFQEHATNNQIRYRVMDAIGNVATSDAQTVVIAAANPSISGDQVFNSAGTSVGTIGSNWTNTLNPRLRWTSVQDTGSGLASRAIDSRTILYLPLDEGSGTSVVDRSSNAAMGTLDAGAAWGTGIFGQAINSTGGGIELSTITALNNLSAVTAQAWIKSTGVTSACDEFIIGKSSYSPTGFLLTGGNGCLTTGRVTFFAGSCIANGGSSGLSSTVSVYDRRWHLITATQDSTTKRLYIDGVLDNSGTCTGTLNLSNALPIQIGKETRYSSGRFPGLIDEPQIYNYVKSAAEVAADWRKGFNRFHQVEISTDSGSSYFLVNPASTTIDGADGSVSAQTLTSDVGAAVCPNGWTRGTPGKSFGNSCYLAVTSGASWTGARDDCRARGGDLASIGSSDENDFLQTLQNGVSNFWIGLNDSVTEGTYVWSDATPFGYTRWASGEPTAGTSVNCVNISNTSGQWTVRDCAATTPYYFCKMRASSFKDGSNNRVRVTAFDQTGSSTAVIYTANVDVSPPKPPTITEVLPSTWTSLTSLPVARYIPASAINNNTVYIIGGNDTGAVPKADVYYAQIGPDGVISTWTATTSLPVARGNLSKAVVFNNRIYVLGGYNSGTKSDVYYASINADGSLGSWSTATSLPEARYDHAAEIFNGRIYVTGGFDSNSNRVATVYYATINADGTLGSWTTTTSLPVARRAHASSVFNNFIYLLGGDDAAVAYNTVYYAPINADGTVGTWAQTSSLPATRLVHSAVVLNNRLYSIGGYNTVNYSAAINADGSLGSWSSNLADLPDTLGQFGSVVFNNKIYVIAGYASPPNAARSAVYVASVTFSGVTFPSHQQISVSLSSAATDALNAHATPNRVELFTTLACTGTATYDSSWSAATSFAATSLSTSSAHYVRVRGRDTLLNESTSSCVGPFYPQDNTAPKPPTLTEVLPSTWTSAASLPVALSRNSSVVNNNQVYVLSGLGVSGALNPSVFYASIGSDGVISTWTATTSLPEGREHHASVVLNNRVYVLGGYDTGVSAKTYFASINSNGTLGSWTAATGLPVAIDQHSAVVFNNRIYALGGHDGTSARAEVYYASINSDGTLGSWTATTSLPAVRRAHTSVVFGNKVYVIGGIDTSGATPTPVYYAQINADGTLGYWATTSSLPIGIYTHSSVILNNRVYTIAGYNLSAGPIANIYSAPINSDGTLGAWSTNTSQPSALYYNSAIAFGNRIYSIDGYDTNASTRVYVASVTFSGVTSPAHQEIDVSLSSAATDALNANATPNRVELFTTLACTGTATYDSSWSAATSFAATSLSTSSAHYVRTRGRDATGLESLGSCVGPYYPQDNTPPLPPTLTEVLPSTWTVSTSLPAALARHASVISNNRVYVLGGNNSLDQGISTVYSALINSDGVISTWTATTSLPEARANHASVVVNNRVYVMGGYDTAVSAKTYFASVNSDGTLGSWTAATNLPIALRQLSAVVFNNRVYVMGGYDVALAARAEVYYASINSDGTLGSWTATTSLPVLRRAHTSVVFNNKVYVIGGADNDGTSQTSAYYASINADGTLGPWAITTSLPTGIHTHSSVILNNRVYTVAGYNSSAGALSNIYSALINSDGSLGVWSTNTSQPAARYYNSAIAFGNQIYSIGGYNSSANASVYVASVTFSGVSLSQAGSLSVSFTAASDSFGSLHATPHWLEVSTNSYCDVAYANSGWFSGTSGSLSLAGGTSYYFQLRGRDAAGNISGFNGCYGPNRVTRSVFVTISSVTTTTSIAQGAKGALLKLQAYTQSGTSNLTSLAVGKLGTVTDGDMDGVELCVDNGDDSFSASSDQCPFGVVPFSNGSATLSFSTSSTYGNLTTSTATYFVVTTPKSVALASTTIGVSIASAGAFGFSTDHQASANAAFNSRLPLVADGASVITVAPDASFSAPTTISKGRANTAFLKMRVTADAGTAELKEFLMRSSGTAIASDITAVKVYRDNGDGTFNANSDTILGISTATFSSGWSTYTFTATQSTLTVRAGTPANLFVVMDISAGAQTGNTVGVALDATGYFRLQGSSDTIATTNFPIVTSPLSTISEPHVLNELWTNKASSGAYQGAILAMGKLQLWTDKAIATVNTLRVELKAGEFDSDVRRVYFYQDSGSGEFESTADTQLTSATFSGRIANLSFTQQTIDTSTRTYFVVYEINPNGNVGQAVTLNIRSGFLGITDNDSVESLSPSAFVSTSTQIQATTDVALFSKASAISKLSADQGKTNFAVFNLRTAMASNGGVWTGLKFTRQGTTPDSNFSKITVWKDADSDRVFTSTGDTAIGSQENSLSGVFISSAVTVDFTESQTLDTTTRYYYVTVNMGAASVVGSTFTLTIASTADVKMQSPDYANSASLPLVTETVDITQFANTIISSFTNSAPSTVAVDDKTVLLGKLRLYSDLNSVTLQSLRVDRLGTSSDADIKRVYLLEDSNGSGSFESISDAVIASGAFTDSSVQFTGLSKTIAAGTASSGGNTFFLTVDISSAATPERTFQLRLLDKSYVGVAYPNQVSSTTFPLSAASVTIKPPPVVVYATPESLAPASALQGSTDVPITKIRLRSNWFSAQLSQLRVNLIGTAQDADIARVKILYDLNGDGVCCQGDSLVSSGQDAFRSGVANISFASAQTINTSTKTYFVLYDLASQSKNVTAGVGINAGSYFTLDSPNSLNEGNLPFASGLVSITPTIAALRVTPGDLAPTFVTQASTNVIFSKLALQTTAYSLSLQGLTLTKIGDLADADITNVRVWQDSNKDGVLQSTETALTDGTRQFANSKVALLFTNPITVDTSGTQILVAFDFSRTAAVGSRVGVRLAAAADAVVNSPNFTVNTGFPMDTSTSPVRDLGDTLNLVLTDATRSEIGQGKSNQPVIKLSAFTNEDSATLTEIRVDKTGGSGSGLADSYIKALKIYRDDGNGVWDGVSQETYLSSVAISGSVGKLALSETVTTSTKTYFITIDIDSVATVGATFGLNIAGNLYVKVASPDSVKDFSNFLTASVSIRDLKVPAIPTVSDEGQYTYLATKLKGNWISSVDDGAITGYEYAVGTSSSSTNIRDWTSVGSSTFTDITGLSLNASTTYYILARAKTSLGYTSAAGYSDGILIDIVRPRFVSAPSVQAEGKSVVCTWTKPSVGESGVVEYTVEQRRAESPLWVSAVQYSTTGAKSLGTLSVMAKPLDTLAATISASQLQVVIQNHPNGTYYYRVSAKSGAGQSSEPSDAVRVVLGIDSQADPIANMKAYPNPVDIRKRSASIYYDLNQNSDVDIVIYDLLGKETQTLNFASGSEGGRQGGNSVTWDGKNSRGESVSFGVYLLRVRAKVSGAKKVYKLAVIH